MPPASQCVALDSDSRLVPESAELGTSLSSDMPERALHWSAGELDDMAAASISTYRLTALRLDFLICTAESVWLLSSPVCASTVEWALPATLVAGLALVAGLVAPAAAAAACAFLATLAFNFCSLSAYLVAEHALA